METENTKNPTACDHLGSSNTIISKTFDKLEQSLLYSKASVPSCRGVSPNTQFQQKDSCVHEFLDE